MSALLRSIRSLTLLLFLVVMARASFGQGITGSITGTVTDSSGAPIAGATVAIRQVGNSLRPDQNRSQPCRISDLDRPAHET